VIISMNVSMRRNEQQAAMQPPSFIQESTNRASNYGSLSFYIHYTILEKDGNVF